jgi:hypothetical protein
MHERLRGTHRIRQRRRMAVAGMLALVSATTLSGCAVAPPPPLPDPEPVPTLTQEQQDFATFQDLFSRYETEDPNTTTRADLDAFLTGDALEEEQKELAEIHDQHRTYQGTVSISNFSVTDHGADDKANHYMVGQACLDISQSHVFGSDGKELYPDRPSTVSLQMKAMKISDGTWRISDVVRNDSTGVCS